MLHLLSLASAMALLWMLLSGLFDGWMLALGVASVVGVVTIARRMDVIDNEGHPMHLGLRPLLYWPWLMLEIAKANIDVTRAIARPTMNIRPRLLSVQASQQTAVGRVIYANSITLTPGTVTLAVDGDRFTVHALTVNAERSLATGDMDRRVRALEGDGGEAGA
ncbi:MAG TPA: Na+/H+ antiporter subunit E [Rhodospirillales bacterium]|nr:Na+/H+ antiporter subunit E [Rhodospirillales bacterium]HJO69296.1 Na+/H+ antiporter subunit E [Rhodospirillales bacterium]